MIDRSRRPLLAAPAEPPNLPLAARLVVGGGLLIRWRPLAVGAALLSRVLRLRAYALWPDVDQPILINDLGHRPAAAWVSATFEHKSPRRGLRRFLSPVLVSALRARGLLIGRPSDLALEAVERAIGRPPCRPRLTVFSTTGETHVKAMCLVFRPGQAVPSVVVKMVPDRRFKWRLRLETEVVERLRERMGASSEIAAALPLPPLYAGEICDDYVVVQELDPLARRPVRDDGKVALDWLRAFQPATTVRTDPWAAADDERDLAIVRDAWRRIRPDCEEAVVSRVSELLAELRGEPVMRCAVHGDFWYGNVVYENEQLRVYDWEWAEEEGTPFFDLWMYELAQIRWLVDLVPPLRTALDRVRGELEARSTDGRFALATLAPAIGLMTFRERGITGVRGVNEETARPVMEAAEQLLLRA